MTTEKYNFREADKSDFFRIAAFFKSQDYNAKNEKCLKWKYRQNPIGKGRIFLMENSKGEIAGTLGYIPFFLPNPQTPPLLVMEAIDLFFAPEARGNHNFPKLQRIAMDNIEYPLIAFPNIRSEKITLKLGWRKSASIDKWYFPIRFVPSSNNVNMRVINRVINVILDTYAQLFLIGFRYKIKLVPVKKFKNSFNKMQHKLWTGHSSEFLNWRFDGNFMQQYLKFEFHFKQNVIGYCVLKEERSAGAIYDFFVSSHQRACLRAIIEHCKKREMNRLIFRGVGLKLWRFGFTKWFSKTHLISYDLSSHPQILTLSISDW